MCEISVKSASLVNCTGLGTATSPDTMNGTQNAGMRPNRGYPESCPVLHESSLANLGPTPPLPSTRHSPMLPRYHVTGNLVPMPIKHTYYLQTSIPTEARMQDASME